LYFFQKYNRRDSSSTIQENIALLRSEDFNTLKKAQYQIIAVGKPALPELLSVMHSSQNEEQIGLCCNVIGEIDGEAYKNVLIECAVPGKICMVLRYPDWSSIKKLPSAQRSELLLHFKKLATSVSKEEAACIENLIQQL
jgi:hypothetical protein